MHDIAISLCVEMIENWKTNPFHIVLSERFVLLLPYDVFRSITTNITSNRGEFKVTRSRDRAVIHAIRGSGRDRDGLVTMKS